MSIRPASRFSGENSFDSYKFIDVYAGPGSWRPSVDSTIEMVRENDTRRIREVTELKSFNPDVTDCLIISGGHAPTILFNNPEAKIEKYVQEGGKFLGICAGAVVATDEVVSKPVKFPVTTREEVKSLHEEGSLYLRKLNMKKKFSWSFYPGSCVAPHIVKNTEPTDLNNFCAADIVTSRGPCKSPFYWGPAFLRTAEGTEVIATFKAPIKVQEVIEEELTGVSLEKEDPAAILFYRHGRGKVVLSAVHPELNPVTFPEYANKDGFPGSLPVGLEQEESRRRLISEMFSRLNS